MANPQDYRLSYTRSGMPVLEGKSGQSVRELSAEQARKRLNELIYEEGRESASSRPAPRPRTRPQLPATPAVSAPPVKPVQPISEPVSQTLGTLAQRMPQRAIGSLPSLQRSPAASLLLQQTGLTEPKRPAKVAVPEEEVEKALEGVEDADRLTEDARRAQYLSLTISSARLESNSGRDQVPLRRRLAHAARLAWARQIAASLGRPPSTAARTAHAGQPV